MNYLVFGKIMEYMRKHRDIKLVSAERRRNYLVLEPNNHTTIFFPEHLSATEMKNKKVLMNTPVYLGLPIIKISKKISKITMCEFWCNYIKPKYGEKVKLCLMDTVLLYTQKQMILFRKSLYCHSHCHV